MPGADARIFTDQHPTGFARVQTISYVAYRVGVSVRSKRRRRDFPIMSIPAVQSSGAMQIGLEGYRRATRRMDASAAQIASPSRDLMDPGPMVEMKMAETQGKASLAVVRTAQRMQDSLLDILA